MSGYRDDREAAVARIETLEAKVREREAGLDARDAEISELRAEIERLRSGISTPERRAAPRWPLLAVVAAGVMIAGVLGAMVTLRTTVPSPARATSEPPPAPAPPPPAPPAPTPVTTTSPPAWAMVRSGTVKVKACFDHELTKRPNLTGRVDVTLTATGGTVTHVELAPSPVRSAPFDACVTTAFLGLTVPVSEGPTTINVPFNFTAQ